MRYDRQVGQNTAVKFMTDGILLRELQSDLLLRSYSVLVLDEAHERSLNTDLLLGKFQEYGFKTAAPSGSCHGYRGSRNIDGLKPKLE